MAGTKVFSKNHAHIMYICVWGTVIDDEECGLIVLFEQLTPLSCFC